MRLVERGSLRSPGSSPRPGISCLLDARRAEPPVLGARLATLPKAEFVTSLAIMPGK